MDSMNQTDDRDYLLASTPGTPLHVIFIQVCSKYNVSPTDMLSRRRLRRLAWPRQEFYWRARNETIASLPEIGRFIGGRDHSTVAYGSDRHEKRMQGASV